MNKIKLKKHLLYFFIISIIYFIGYYLLIECLNFSVSSKVHYGHGFSDVSYMIRIMSQLILSIIISFIFFVIFLISKFLKKFSMKLLFIPLFLIIIINSFSIIMYINDQSMQPYYFIGLSFIELPTYIPLVILYFIISIIENTQKDK